MGYEASRTPYPKMQNDLESTLPYGKLQLAWRKVARIKSYTYPKMELRAEESVWQYISAAPTSADLLKQIAISSTVLSPEILFVRRLALPVYSVCL